MSIEPYLALGGAIFGGVGLKIVEGLITRKKTDDDTATQIRTELRGEIKSLKDELEAAHADLDEWKLKYYDLLDNFYSLKREIVVDKQGKK